MPRPPAQLAVLASLGAPLSLAALAKANGRSQDTIRTAVQALEKERLVTTQPVGRELRVHASSPILVSHAKALIFEVGRPDWKNVFHGDRPKVLRVLHQVGRAILTAEVLDKPRRTVYQIIEDLAKRGIIQIGSGRRTLEQKPWEEGPRVPGGGFASTGTKYRIHQRLHDLIAFLEEADRVAAHARIRELDPKAHLIWHLGPETLYATTSEYKGTHLGGLSALSALGVDLMTSRTYYHECARTPTPADAILQTLLIDPPSQINRSYAAVAFEKARPHDLYEKACIYGLEKEAVLLHEYVESRGTKDTTGFFLPWDAHDRYRIQYGV